MKFYPTKYKNYFVTEDGKVWSNYIAGGQGRTQTNLREHIPKVDKDGYKEVCLSLGNNKRKYIRVHRLVYESIIGDIPPLLTIDHINKDVSDNNIHNLRLMSREQNTQLATRRPVIIKLDGSIYNFNSNKEAIQFLGVSECSYFKYKKGKTSHIKKYKNNKLEIIEGATTIETVPTM